MEKHIHLMSLFALSVLAGACLANGDSDNSSSDDDDDDTTPTVNDDDDTSNELPNPSTVDEARMLGIHVSWLTDASNSMAVTWITPGAEEAAGVWWGESEDALDNPVQAQLRQWETLILAQDGSSEPGTAYAYWLNITGLEPDTTYFYKVVNADASSETYSFRTGPEKGSTDPVTFLVFGDSRGAAPTTPSPDYPRIVEQMKGVPADFAINTGDVTNLSFQAEWDTYWERSKGLYESLPVMYAAGNHDLGIGPLALTYLNNLTQDHVLERQYYLFEYGNLAFFMADTNDPEMEGEQYAYGLQALEGSQAQWKFMAYHKPAFSPSTNHGSIRQVQDSLAQLNDLLGLDINFAGHDHVYGRTRFLYGLNPDIKLPEGGGVTAAEVCEGDACEKGTVTIVGGGAGAGLYGAFNDNGDEENDEIARLFARSCGRRSNCFNYQVITVDGNRLEGTSYDADGNVIDEFGWDNIHR